MKHFLYPSLQIKVTLQINTTTKQKPRNSQKKGQTVCMFKDTIFMLPIFPVNIKTCIHFKSAGIFTIIFSTQAI